MYAVRYAGSEKIVEAPRSYAEESVIGRLHWLTRGVQAEVRALRPDMLLKQFGRFTECSDPVESVA